MKKQIQGGVDSVRVVPMNFKQGGALDLSTPPPKSINSPVSFNEGGNVDSLMPRFDQFSPEQKQQLDEEIYRKHFFDMMNEQILRDEMEKDRYFQMEQEKRKRQYYQIPDLRPAGGIMNVPSPNFSQENNLKPAGILSINKVYDI
jgi:hypothetical protein